MTLVYNWEPLLLDSFHNISRHLQWQDYKTVEYRKPLSVEATLTLKVTH